MRNDYKQRPPAFEKEVYICYIQNVENEHDPQDDKGDAPYNFCTFTHDFYLLFLYYTMFFVLFQYFFKKIQCLTKKDCNDTIDL